jgi:hydroxymethylpyrimidine pyrophosphatase-like HAD family hydrolase
MGVYKTLYDEVTEQVSDMREFILSKAGELEKINIYFRSRKERQEVFEKMRGLPLSMAYSEQTSLEVSPASTTKGTGLSIAVANAKQQVLKISDVVVSDNDHDGVAEAIERYLC